MTYKVPILSILSILLVVTSCKKEKVNNKPSDRIFVVEEKSDSTFYFRGTINGVQKDWTVLSYKNGENLPYRFNAASAVQALSQDCESTYCKYMLEDVSVSQNNGTGPAKNYIGVGFNISSKTGDRSEIIQQFNIGLKGFGKPRRTINDPVKDGVYVYYLDENGKEWCSHFGSVIQTNSIFKSEQLLPQPFPNISCSNIWKATFSCTLHDKSGGSIQVVNAEISSPVFVKR